MMVRSSRAGPLLAGILLAFAAACQRTAPADAAATPGEPVAGLTEGERARFLLGRALFERIATPEEGLGPLFNAERCSACHDEPASGGGGTRVLVLKATAWEDGLCRVLDEHGGDNIQLRATPLLEAEGLGAEQIPAQATATALVTAPPLFGLGLLEAVPDAWIEERADPDDADGDGISGVVPRLGDGRVARFGRKGDAVSVRDFVESALRFELGFTTESYPAEERRNGVALPARVDPRADPEIDRETLTLLTDYVRLLAPPAPEPVTGAAADTIAEGERLFTSIGCSDCHVPSLTTGDAPERALALRRIEAYTDLLLHDLGGGAGDVCTSAAPPGEYRTPALWGLRFRSHFLHNRRAATVEAAIRAHGGEAARAAAAFDALSPEARRALLRFLSTL